MAEPNGVPGANGTAPAANGHAPRLGCSEEARRWTEMINAWALANTFSQKFGMEKAQMEKFLGAGSVPNVLPFGNSFQVIQRDESQAAAGKGGGAANGGNDFLANLARVAVIVGALVLGVAAALAAAALWQRPAAPAGGAAPAPARAGPESATWDIDVEYIPRQPGHRPDAGK